MQNRILVKTDADGVRTFLCRDLAANKQWIETEEPVDIIIDQNRAAQNAFSSTSRLGDLVVQAEVPETLWWAWHREGITEDEKALRRRLNDADWKNLRTNNLRL